MNFNNNYAPFYLKLHQALEPKDDGKSDTYNEHDTGDEQQYVDGYCSYCGAEEYDCPRYKCWI